MKRFKEKVKKELALPKDMKAEEIQRYIRENIDHKHIKSLVDEYIDGAYEQSHHQNHRQVKAYNYRVYKTCRKLISRFLKEHNGTLTQFEIEQFLENLTLEAEKVIQDKAKTYSMPFEDQDMVRKTIILLFQECYLAFDEGRKVDE